MKTLEMALKPKYLFGVPLALLFLFALAGCNDAPRQDTQVVHVGQVQTQPSCGRFYDQEEGGMVTQCFDPGNRSCFTLYEPDGDQEYYCNGEKIWEIEPGDNWNGSWAFLAGMAVADVSRPKYVSNKTKPKSKRPVTYTRPTYKTTTKPGTNSKQALNAASKQTTTATPKQVTSKTNSNANAALAAAAKQTNTVTPNTKGTLPAKPKVDLTKKAPAKPKVDLTKKTPAKPKVDLTKKTPAKPKVVLTKKKKCTTKNGKTVCK